MNSAMIVNDRASSVVLGHPTAASYQLLDKPADTELPLSIAVKARSSPVSLAEKLCHFEYF